MSELSEDKKDLLKGVVACAMGVLVLLILVFMQSYLLSLVKEMSFTHLDLDVNDKVASMVYDFSWDCGFFTSDIDCLGATVDRVEMAEDLEPLEKERALKIAKKLVYL